MENENSSKEQICSICGRNMNVGFGNNAQPVNDGICCNNCYLTIVIPTKIRLATRLENNIKRKEW